MLAQSANLIDPSRNALFDTRLTPIARMAGASNLEDFVDMLKADRPAHLHRAVAEAMTINETSFFRDLKPFEMLREVILPQLIEQRTEERRLRIWSAASSTGQEAYSLAMLIAEYFPRSCAMGCEDCWDGHLAAGGGVCAAGAISAAGGESRVAGADAGEVYGARRGGVGGCSADSVDVRVPVCESVRAVAADCRCSTWCCCGMCCCIFRSRSGGRSFSEVYRQMAPDGYLVLGNAEQAEDSTNLFEVEFAANCYFYRPVNGA